MTKTNFASCAEAEAALQPGQIVADNGPNVWPRFTVIDPPKVGDKVSYGFNGDYYPDGKIVAVGKNYRTVTTSTGNKYWRRKESGSWLLNRTWSLVPGHHDERNPHF